MRSIYLLLLTAPAFATSPPESPTAVGIGVSHAEGGFATGGNATANNTASGQASATASASPSADNSFSDNSDTSVLAFTTPNGYDCFGGISAGHKVSLLAVHKRNKGCVLQAAALNERSAELQALLKCGDKVYREAIAYDRPKDERQSYCVQKLTAIYTAPDRAILEQLRQAEHDLAVTRRSLASAEATASSCKHDVNTLEDACTK